MEQGSRFRAVGLGIIRSMKTLSMAFCRHGNFGDALNFSLASSFGVESHRHAFGGQINDDFAILGIGTILTGRLKVNPNSKLIVFGSGYGVGPKSSSLPGRFGEELPSNMDIRFVRGPLSCDALDLPHSKHISDGAYVFGKKFREMSLPIKKTTSLGYIPHWQSPHFLPGIWGGEDLKPFVINPMLPVGEFIEAVASCERVVTEALHGAILADMLRIPFTIVQTSPFFNSFKWLDWLSSIQLPFTVGALHSARDFKSYQFINSDQRVLERVESSVWDEFLHLREDIAALRSLEN